LIVEQITGVSELSQGGSAKLDPQSGVRSTAAVTPEADNLNEMKQLIFISDCTTINYD